MSATESSFMDAVSGTWLARSASLRFMPDTSMVKLSGMSSGKQSISISRLMTSNTPP